MSLGPVGASLNPEQAENFEDVGNEYKLARYGTDTQTDGEAIRRQRSFPLRFSAFLTLRPFPTEPSAS